MRRLRNLRPLLFVFVAAAVRTLVAYRTALPERDAAHYLWMADGLLCGESKRLFHSVFHPLFAALIGVVRAALPALDPMVAGQLVACGCSSLTVLPLWSIGRRLGGERAAVATALCFTLGTWFVRHPADVLSEGLFHPLVATAIALLASAAASPRAAITAGLCAAMAYATRPEGATLGVVGFAWLWSTGHRVPALRFALGASPALLLPVLWSTCGPGFTLTPKAAFVWNDGVGAHGASHYLEHLGLAALAIPEALGYVVAVGAFVGGWIAWHSNRRPIAVLSFTSFVVQLLTIPILRSHHRFLSGFGVLLLPFAGLAWARMHPLLVRRAAFAPLLVAAASFVVDLVRLPRARRFDLLVERRLGEWMRPQLGPTDRVASESQRVDYFAGVEPAPPRRIEPSEIEAIARDPKTRFVVWVDSRPRLDERALAAAGFEPAELPAALGAECGAHGIKVWIR